MADEQNKPKESTAPAAASQETTAAAAQPAQSASSPTQNSPSEKKPGSSACMIIAIIAGIIVVLGIITIAIMFFVGRGLFNRAMEGVGNLPSVTAVATSGSVGIMTADELGIDEAVLDQTITENATGMAAPGITGVKVTDKLYYQDSSGTIWLKYTVTPIPVNAADPATGVMKKVVGGDWEGVDFGTAGLASSLPSDVVSALGIQD